MSNTDARVVGATIYPPRRGGVSDSAAGEAEFELPSDLVVKARQRLVFVSTAFVILSALASALLLPFDLTYGATANVLGFSVWLFVAIAARTKRLSDMTALYAGLGGLVAFTMVTSTLIPRHVYLTSGSYPDPTWTLVLMVAFPLVVPVSPRRLAAALVITALTVPAGYFINARTTPLAFSLHQMVSISVTGVYAGTISYLGSRLVYGLGIDIARERQLGAYKLESKLGAGGMGEVWLASHRMLARPAAIKLIRPEHLASRSQVDRRAAILRFEREAHATASLRSPHTVHLYDFGVTEEGALYYVMEHLDGQDLEQLVLAHGAQSPARTVHLLRQVCHSLEEAHEGGLVHRDIKPSNIIVCRQGLDLDFVKLVDFGLVAFQRAWDDKKAQPGVLTDESRVVGTPAYLPPEIVVSATEFDARADIYALGCVAFWLLTGRLVFDKDTVIELALAHVNDAPPDPSELAPAELPAALRDLVLECLAKNPKDRPQSARALSERLARIADDLPWSVDQARAWWATH